MRLFLQEVREKSGCATAAVAHWRPEVGRAGEGDAVLYQVCGQFDGASAVLEAMDDRTNRDFVGLESANLMRIVAQ